MKTIKILGLVVFVTLSFASCKKDEDGQWIRYYKNKIGVGYVFWKNDDGTIEPIKNVDVSITAFAYSGSGELFTVRHEHTDNVKTKNDGSFKFKFVKKIDNSRKPSDYEIQVDVKSLPIIIEDTYYFTIGCKRYDGDILLNSNETIITDTIFLKSKYSNSEN
jgi:hypothetical protein